MHSIALMVYPNFQSLSLSLGSVFECANLLRGEQAYEFHLVSESGGPIRPIRIACHPTISSMPSSSAI